MSRNPGETVLGFILIMCAVVMVGLLMVGLVLVIAKVLTNFGDTVRQGIPRMKASGRIKAFNAKKCFHCGYDLRVKTDRCPEFGHHIPIRPIF